MKSRKLDKTSRGLPERLAQQRPAIPAPAGARVVTLRSIDPDGTVIVEVAGEGRPRSALLGLSATPTELLAAIRERRRALLVETPEGGVLVGLVRERLDVDREESARDEACSPHLELRATESLELVCGRSRLRMEKSGRVTLSGTDVSEEASGTARIAAADVRIN